MSPAASLIICAGLLGLLFGSFLNVCIVRWVAEQSVIRPRSRCPQCKAGIAWYDNIPVVSWMVLGGKCRHCSLPIPIFYPAVELATGVFWALAFGYYGLSVEALRAAVFAMILLGIAVSDGRDFIIPDEFSIGGAVVGLLLAFAGGQISWQQSLLGAGVGIFLLWGVAVLGTKLFRKEAMGFGDVKMMAMLGAFLGWQQVLLTLFLASVIGVIIYLPMKLAGKERLVPFGVFLALGGATCWIVGPSLIDWYVGTLGLR